jgi:hypothetical protein
MTMAWASRCTLSRWSGPAFNSGLNNGVHNAIHSIVEFDYLFVVVYILIISCNKLLLRAA